MTEALTHGYNLGFLVTALACLVAAAISVLSLRGGRKLGPGRPPALSSAARTWLRRNPVGLTSCRSAGSFRGWAAAGQPAARPPERCSERAAPAPAARRTAGAEAARDGVAIRDPDPFHVRGGGRRARRPMYGQPHNSSNPEPAGTGEQQ